MARAIWTGALSFGLVNVPVEVHTAVRESRPRFRMLHAKDRSPIHFERVCQKEGQAVAWEGLEDDYHENLMRLIKAKMKGKPADLVSDEQPRESNVVDLMERLRRSLEKSGGRARAGGGASRGNKPARTRKRPAPRHAA